MIINCKRIDTSVRKKNDFGLKAIALFEHSERQGSQTSDPSLGVHNNVILGFRTYSNERTIYVSQRILFSVGVHFVRINHVIYSITKMSRVCSSIRLAYRTGLTQICINYYYITRGYIRLCEHAQHRNTKVRLRYYNVARKKI